MHTDEFGRHLYDLLEPSVRAMGYDLVRVRYTGARTRPVLQIMAERPDGSMDVEDCAEVSRAVSALLDVEDPIAGEYELEVSSPGIDRPLVRPEDFERFAGFDAKIELARPRDGRRRFRGRLKGLDGSTVLLEVTGQGPEPVIERLDLPEISEARLLLTDELIRASLKAEERRKKAAKAETEHK
ncbi:MAG: ribosome maturation factor RimP [Alphaproteobacteria bacterium]